MSPAGPDRTVQADFSAGIVRGVRPEVAPSNSLFDLVNGLYSDDRAVFKRGGSSFYSSAGFGSSLTFLWDGLLSGGQRTVIGNRSGLATVSTGGAVTAVSGSVGVTEPGRAATMNGKLYLPGGQTYDGGSIGTALQTTPFYAVVANRLLSAGGRRVGFSGIGTPDTFDVTDFHEMPEGVQVIGLEPLRDAAAVFTTGGVFVIGNLSLNLTDSDGNVQQRLDQFSRDLVLWGNAGIAGWEGALVVPATDGVWLMSRGVASEAPVPFQRVSDSITPIYQQYVNAGLKPGLAAVYRGHYFLPILDASNEPVDLLVCRLNMAARTYPWSRLAGYGARLTGLTVRVSPSTARAPQLLGASSAGRVLGLAYLEPSAAGGGTATISASRVTAHSSGVDWGAFDWGSSDWGVPADSLLAAATLTGTAPADTYGETPHSWTVGSKKRSIRFRLWSTSGALDADGSAPEFDLVTRDFLTGALVNNTVTKLRLGYQLVANGGALVVRFLEVFVRRGGRL